MAGNNKTLLDLHVEYPILTRLGVSRQFPESSLTEILPVGIVLIQENLGQIDRRTDGQKTDMKKLTGFFRSYATSHET